MIHSEGLMMPVIVSRKGYMSNTGEVCFTIKSIGYRHINSMCINGLTIVDIRHTVPLGY